MSLYQYQCHFEKEYGGGWELESSVQIFFPPSASAISFRVQKYSFFVNKPFDVYLRINWIKISQHRDALSSFKGKNKESSFYHFSIIFIWPMEYWNQMLDFFSWVCILFDIKEHFFDTSVPQSRNFLKSGKTFRISYLSSGSK